MAKEMSREELEAKRARLALEAEEGRPGAEEELDAVELELARFKLREERATVAAKARAERELEQKRRAKADAIAAMERMLGKLDRKVSASLDALRSKKAEAEEVRKAYVLLVQVYALGNDLADVTGKLIYRRDWNVRQTLGLWKDLAPELFVPGGAPRVPEPWAELREAAKWEEKPASQPPPYEDEEEAGPGPFGYDPRKPLILR